VFIGRSYPPDLTEASKLGPVLRSGRVDPGQRVSGALRGDDFSIDQRVWIN